VLAQLDKLVEPLEKTLTAKLKSDAVKQEVRAVHQDGFVLAERPMLCGKIHHVGTLARQKGMQLVGVCDLQLL
jgi:hypothetical protein